MNEIKRVLYDELPFIFICPALLWQILFLYIPITILFFSSVVQYDPSTSSYTITLYHYAQLFKFEYLKIIFNSLLLAFETTIVCLIIAYPLACFLTFKAKRHRILYLFFLILPSWSSFILQVYAWFFLLKKGGFLSNILYTLRLTSQPVHMLNNHFAVIVGMVYCFLPFMILPLFAVLDKIDKRLLEASADLGANRWASLKNIVLPLSFPGIITGVFLVFIPAFGEFAIPVFLGGAKNLYVGNVIVAKFLDYRDWQSGSAVAFSSVLVPLIAIILFYLSVKIVRKVMVQVRW